MKRGFRICVIVGATVFAACGQAPSVTITIPLGSGGGPVTSMQVQRSTTSGGPYTTIGTATQAVVQGQTVYTYTDSTVMQGATYFYVAEAINSTGTSPASPQSNAAAIPVQAPATPGTPTAVVNP
jgi:hypothetical protein